MPHIKILINHKIGQSNAMSRIQHYLLNSGTFIPSQVTALSIKWIGNVANFSFKTAKIPVFGTLNISNDSVEINSKLPLVFLPLKSQIENIIRQHANKILE